MSRGWRIVRKGACRFPSLVHHRADKSSLFGPLHGFAEDALSFRARFNLTLAIESSVPIRRHAARAVFRNGCARPSGAMAWSALPYGCKVRLAICCIWAAEQWGACDLLLHGKLGEALQAPSASSCRLSSRNKQYVPGGRLLRGGANFGNRDAFRLFQCRQRFRQVAFCRRGLAAAMNAAIVVEIATSAMLSKLWPGCFEFVEASLFVIKSGKEPGWPGGKTEKVLVLRGSASWKPRSRTFGNGGCARSKRYPRRSDAVHGMAPLAGSLRTDILQRRPSTVRFEDCSRARHWTRYRWSSDPSDRVCNVHTSGHALSVGQDRATARMAWHSA